MLFTSIVVTAATASKRLIAGKIMATAVVVVPNDNLKKMTSSTATQVCL